MKKTLIVLSAAAALIILPARLTAQGFAVGGRAGTLGFGAEVAFAFGPNVAVRGGMGLWPIEFDATKFWDVGDAVDATLTLPEKWYNVGADLYLGAGFRIGGGVLFKSDDPTITASPTGTGTIEIDGHPYSLSDITEVVGSIDSKSKATYALIGFGRHTSTGVGLFLDLGVAFLGDSPVKLEARGNSTVINSGEFQSRLEQERLNLEEDLPTWAKKYWPILNLGIKLGIG